MITLTCPHPTLSRHSHAPHRRPPHGPSSHTPCRCAPRSCTLTVCLYVFVYLFLTNFLFCSLVMRCDDSHHNCSTTRCAMTRTTCSTVTETATTTPHGVTIPHSPTVPATPCAVQCHAQTCWTATLRPRRSFWMSWGCRSLKFSRVGTSLGR